MVIQTCTVMPTLTCVVMLTHGDTDMHGDADTDSDTDMRGDADTDTVIQTCMVTMTE